MTTPGKIYFASDFHLGAPDAARSLEREKKVVRWLNMIQPDAKAVYLLGDLFDFWYEYKRAVPKGFTRLLGKLADFSDSGVPVHIFPGNHDLWMRDYLEQETGAIIHKKPVKLELNGKKFYLAHGDGLGPGDLGFKIMKTVFTNKAAQWMFSRVHPNTGIGLANYFSRKSRMHTGKADEKFLGEDREWLILYAKEVLKKEHFDYFIFGHRHFPLEFPIGSTIYVNLGDWLEYCSYAEWDGKYLSLKYFKN